MRKQQRSVRLIRYNDQRTTFSKEREESGRYIENSKKITQIMIMLGRYRKVAGAKLVIFG
jgi:hypothetical protein